MSGYEIRKLNPVRRRLWRCLLILVFTVLLVISYFLGYHRANINFAKLNQEQMWLRSQLSKVKEREQRFLDDSVLLRRSKDMDKATLRVVKEEVASLQAVIVELKEELVFYRSLLNPGERKRGLYLQSLNLVPIEKGRYRYTLVLTQIGQNDKFAKGEVLLYLVPKDTDTERETDVLAVPGVHLQRQPFNFKFFQRIEGEIDVLTEIEPMGLKVQALPVGKRLRQVEQFFNWDVLMGG